MAHTTHSQHGISMQLTLQWKMEAQCTAWINHTIPRPQMPTTGCPLQNLEENTGFTDHLFNTNCTDNSELCSSPGTINHQLSCPMLYVPIVLKLSELSSNLNRVSCMRISCHKKHHQLPLFNIVSCCQTVQLTYLRG